MGRERRSRVKKDLNWLQWEESGVRQEREKARRLRASQWWKRRVATGRCHYCDRETRPDELTMDHIVPVAQGGKTTRGNVAPVCKECNTMKRSLLPLEWEAHLEKRRQ